MERCDRHKPVEEQNKKNNRVLMNGPWDKCPPVSACNSNTTVFMNKSSFLLCCLRKLVITLEQVQLLLNCEWNCKRKSLINCMPLVFPCLSISWTATFDDGSASILSLCWTHATNNSTLQVSKWVKTICSAHIIDAMRTWENEFRTLAKLDEGNQVMCCTPASSRVWLRKHRE